MYHGIGTSSLILDMASVGFMSVLILVLVISEISTLFRGMIVTNVKNGLDR